MRIFLTGATGYVGSAVLDAALRARHTVTALVRDPHQAQLLAQRDVACVVADLGKPDAYAAVAQACDAIVHTALDRRQGPEVDRIAIEALLKAANRRIADGHSACVIYTSGTWVLGNTGDAAAEDAPLAPTPLAEWRPAHEALVLRRSRGRRVRTIVLRPGSVYGGARGMVGDLLREARRGVMRVVGDGKNRWSCVYRVDLADLYLRLAADPQATGIYHATDGADERVIDIAQAIAGHMTSKPDIRLVPLAEARSTMGAYADALVLDQRVASPRARALGWAPVLKGVSGSLTRLFEEFRRASEVIA